MNTKKFLLASLAVFVTLQILDFVIHNLILGAAYTATQEVWRTDMTDKMWVMYITGAVFSLLFVYIFSKGYEGKGLMEGIKYGLIIGLVVYFVGSFNQFVVYPIPYGLTWQWVIYGLIELMIAGAVAALIYKTKE
jgi:hypothetical protein